MGIIIDTLNSAFLKNKFKSKEINRDINSNKDSKSNFDSMSALEAKAVLGASQVQKTQNTDKGIHPLMKEALEFEEELRGEKNKKNNVQQKYHYYMIDGGDSEIYERYSNESNKRDVLVPTYSIFGAYAKGVDGSMSCPITADEILIYNFKTKTPVYLIKGYKGSVWDSGCSVNSAYKFIDNKLVEIDTSEAENEAPPGRMLTTERL